MSVKLRREGAVRTLNCMGSVLLTQKTWLPAPVLLLTLWVALPMSLPFLGPTPCCSRILPQGRPALPSSWKTAVRAPGYTCPLWGGVRRLAGKWVWTNPGPTCLQTEGPQVE